jgi:hypothetical protein
VTLIIQPGWVSKYVWTESNLPAKNMLAFFPSLPGEMTRGWYQLYVMSYMLSVCVGKYLFFLVNQVGFGDTPIVRQIQNSGFPKWYPNIQKCLWSMGKPVAWATYILGNLHIEASSFVTPKLIGPPPPLISVAANLASG